MIFEIEKAWTDECHHDPSNYIGSFECLGEKYDLYVFTSFGNRHSVCIRYGNESSEYLSPGEITSFIKSSHLLPYYQDALELMQSKGRIVFQKN